MTSTIQKEKPGRGGKKGTNDEESKLKKDIKEGKSLEYLAKSHGRTRSAVNSRLLKIVHDEIKLGGTQEETLKKYRVNLDSYKLYASKKEKEDTKKQEKKITKKKVDKSSSQKISESKKQPDDSKSSNSNSTTEEENVAFRGTKTKSEEFKPYKN